mmetsp:Transcript_21000/g.38136  ORF Transcript_21000/g.38136 Transcript_21000/m.38136 type:complete len:271 (-) Transcript_21000:64-876(-)
MTIVNIHLQECIGPEFLHDNDIRADMKFASIRNQHGWINFSLQDPRWHSSLGIHNIVQVVSILECQILVTFHLLIDLLNGLTKVNSFSTTSHGFLEDSHGVVFTHAWERGKIICQFVSRHIPFNQEGRWTHLKLFTTTSLHSPNKFVFIFESIEGCGGSVECHLESIIFHKTLFQSQDTRRGSLFHCGSSVLNVGGGCDLGVGLNLGGDELLLTGHLFEKGVVLNDLLHDPIPWCADGIIAHLFWFLLLFLLFQVGRRLSRRKQGHDVNG